MPTTAGVRAHRLAEAFAAGLADVMLHVHALPHLMPKALEIGHPVLRLLLYGEPFADDLNNQDVASLDARLFLAFAGVTMESLLPLTRAIQPPVLRERISC